jgi:cytochrome c oxidase cbb3-type subunit 3
VAAIALLEAIAVLSEPTPPGAVGNAEAGKKIYKSKCVACHKADGSGGIKLTGNPTPDWRDSTRMADPKFGDDYLRNCIANGNLKSGMAAWSKQGVKPAQINDLIAYIRTFPGAKKAKK